MTSIPHSGAAFRVHSGSWSSVAERPALHTAFLIAVAVGMAIVLSIFAASII